MGSLENAVKSVIMGVGAAMISATLIYGLPALYKEMPLQTRAMIGESLVTISGQGYNDSGKSMLELEKESNELPYFPLELGLTITGVAGIFASSYRSTIKSPEDRPFSPFD